MSDGPQRAPGHEIYARNRQRTAERDQWPDGALDTCEAIEADHPTWFVSYHPAGPDSPARYSAWRDGRQGDEPHLHAATPDLLRTAIENHKWPRYR